VAFDPSERQLAYAFSRPHDNRVTFRVGDGIEIETEDWEFDVAAASKAAVSNCSKGYRLLNQFIGANEN
jgi:hypothetical protein